MAYVLLWSTVPPGLEEITMRELGSIFGDNCKSKAIKERGKVHFQVSHEEFLKIKSMRSVDNLFALVEQIPDFCKDEENIKGKLEMLPMQLQWTNALQVWQEYTGYSHPVEILKQTNSNNPTHSGGNKADMAPSNIVTSSDDIPLSDDTTSQDIVPSKIPDMDSNVIRPRFRVTCNRSGRQHTFSSPQAATYFGGGIDDYFDWKVNLSEPDIEVILNISGDSATIGIALTKESLHKRDIKHFGAMTLRSTIAYGLLSLADISPGDIVCDPMCGSGAVSVEGAITWPNSYHLCGDNGDAAVSKARANAEEQDSRQCSGIDVIRWDVCNLPLRTASLDVIVTDMPFGKRSGSKSHNRTLYPRALNEMARVCRPGSSKCVILTQDQKVMIRIIRGSQWWKQRSVISVNVGGIAASIYVLSRTVNAYFGTS
jgi:23S rRNA G2445 N2-methylase RlmL